MDIFSMICILNMVLKSYEIVYIFVTPSLPLMRRYLISENVDNSGRPLCDYGTNVMKFHVQLRYIYVCF